MVRVGGKRVKPYSSGSFWISAIAAMGIPKLDAGPQKSALPGSQMAPCFH